MDDQRVDQPTTLDVVRALLLPPATSGAAWPPPPLRATPGAIFPCEADPGGSNALLLREFLRRVTDGQSPSRLEGELWKQVWPALLGPGGGEQRHAAAMDEPDVAVRFPGIAPEGAIVFACPRGGGTLLVAVHHPS